jgi:DNA-binding MarR family transcriptional regulator
MASKKRDDYITEILNNFHTIKRAHSSGSRFSSQQFGMTITQASVMMMLLHEGRKTMSEMAQALGISRGAATQLLEGLTAQGLLRRYQDETDRRIVYVELSQKGRERLRAMRANGATHVSDLFQVLTDEELAYVEKLTTKLASKAKEMNA